MAEKTGISWTDATWSPWEGCTKISPGCENCYAASMNGWLKKGANWGPGAPRHQYGAAHWEKPLLWNTRPFFQCTRCTWRGERKPTLLHGFNMVSCPLCLNQLKRSQRRVFPSVCDPFDNEVDPTWRTEFFRLIRATPWIDWLLLTKRIGNAARMVTDAHMEIGSPAGDSWDSLPSNALLGATIVNRDELLRDGPKLKEMPARVHFWSVEPLLGDMGRIPVEMLPDWVIVGGESGRGARDFSIDAARNIVRQCQAAGVPVHVKQMGARPVEADADGSARKVIFIATAGRDATEWPEDLRVQEFPKA